MGFWKRQYRWFYIFRYYKSRHLSRFIPWFLTNSAIIGTNTPKEHRAIFFCSVFFFIVPVQFPYFRIMHIFLILSTFSRYFLEIYFSFSRQQDAWYTTPLTCNNGRYILRIPCGRSPLCLASFHGGTMPPADIFSVQSGTSLFLWC